MMIDTQYQDTPVCPHCGWSHSNAWEWEAFGSGMEGSGEFECENCDKEFFAERIATIEYTTKKIETKQKKQND
jgi:transposase-like protein